MSLKFNQIILNRSCLIYNTRFCLLTSKQDDSIASNSDLHKEVHQQQQPRKFTLSARGVMDYLYGVTGALQDIVGVVGTSEPIASTMPSTSVSKPSWRSAGFSRDALDSRACGLVQKLKDASSSQSKLTRCQELCEFLLQHSDTRPVIIEHGIASFLMRTMHSSRDMALIYAAREALALLGYVPNLRGHGLKILAIDGGGTRGLMALEVLEAIESLCGGKRIAELFDYVIGVSTGAIIAALVAGLHLTIPQCKQIYRDIAAQLFDQSRFRGATGLLRSHSYYSTEQWVKMLQQTMGNKLLLDTARDDKCPRIGFISIIANRRRIEGYLFRNYQLPVDRPSYYDGSCKYKLWQALQASGAAPGYFQECILDENVHQDGGVLMNNPASVALHEAKLLWPGEEVQALVSLGCGQRGPIFQKKLSNKPEFSSLKEKIIKVIDSAADTDKTHMILNDLLSPQTYYRFNPYISESYSLDENDNLRLNAMQQEAQQYIRKNEEKLIFCAGQLLEQRHWNQKIMDWLKYQKIMRF